VLYSEETNSSTLPERGRKKPDDHGERVRTEPHVGRVILQILEEKGPSKRLREGGSRQGSNGKSIALFHKMTAADSSELGRLWKKEENRSGRLRRSANSEANARIDSHSEARKSILGNSVRQSSIHYSEYRGGTSPEGCSGLKNAG